MRTVFVPFEECSESSRRQEFPATPQAPVGSNEQDMRERDAVHRQSVVCKLIHLLCQQDIFSKILCITNCAVFGDAGLLYG